ncbi:hypothetical protein [Pseudomonas sp. RL]|uniref:hypothetical protein n=1 Tax=Pseudomonas sp. RL TaxID=1452718 RepID=UPI0004878D4E|nr:hypothetical protein [Pseudomonas sp. RL]
MKKIMGASVIVASSFLLSACHILGVDVPSIPELVQKNHWEGKPIDAAMVKWGQPLKAEKINNEITAYIWDFSRTRSITYEADSYAYYNTDRPGMTTGIVYDTKNVNVKCKLILQVDNQSKLITNYRLDKDYTRAGPCQHLFYGD